MSAYADAGSLGVVYTGQTVTFLVDGEEALIIDATSVDLIARIVAAIDAAADPAPRAPRDAAGNP